MAMICEKTISGKMFSKNVFSIKRSKSNQIKKIRGQKRSSFLQNCFFSRNYPVAEKLEQLEQNRKKHLIAHLTGYQRLSIGFEL